MRVSTCLRPPPPSSWADRCSFIHVKRLILPQLIRRSQHNIIADLNFGTDNLTSNLVDRVDHMIT